jgi:hypothetical protein
LRYFAADCGEHRQAAGVVAQALSSLSRQLRSEGWEAEMRMRVGLVCLSLIITTNVSAQSLQEQFICAKQAKVAFEKYDADSKGAAPNLELSSEYQSHYNPKLNKCFIDIETAGIGFRSAVLMDAFEQRIYAAYDTDYNCDLTPTSQDKRTCSSKDEYDAFVAKYMEE